MYNALNFAVYLSVCVLEMYNSWSLKVMKRTFNSTIHRSHACHNKLLPELLGDEPTYIVELHHHHSNCHEPHMWLHDQGQYSYCLASQQRWLIAGFISPMAR